MLEQVSEQPQREELTKRLGSLFRGFVYMPFREKIALVAAWFLIMLATTLLRFIAFRHLTGMLGTQIGSTSWIPLIDGRQNENARVIKRAVRRAARISIVRSDCLPQAFAGTILCRMLAIPSAAYLGVKLGQDSDMAAHAWLCAGPIPVTGGNSFEQFSVVMCFVQPKWPMSEAMLTPSSHAS